MRSRSNATLALTILTALNFLNFIDRSILFQVQPLIQREFGVSKMQIGLLTTAFMICFIIAAPVFGLLADRYPRRPIIFAGAIIWSAATLMTAATSNFQTLLIRHAIVGIGEACMVAAPGYVADLFPREKRGRMLAILFMAIPVGTALGYLIGGVLGHLYGWRAPFYVVSGPGMVCALLLLTTREPERGEHDELPHTSTANDRSILALLRNRAYLTATLGLAMITFALGGAQIWMPDFLMNLRGMSMLSASGFLAAVAMCNGVGAILIGGWLADRVRRNRHDADYLVPAAGMLIAIPISIASIYAFRPTVFVAIFATDFLLLLGFGPLGTAIVHSVHPCMRSTAVALQVLTAHLLGDAASPPLIGYIADRTGSLQSGLLVGVAAVAIGSAILFYGRRFVPQFRTLGQDSATRHATAQ